MPRPNDIWSIEASGEGAVFDKIINEEFGGDLDRVMYKPKNPPPQQGGKNVWNKPNPSKMANGQDFFMELRKQVTALVEKEKKDGSASNSTTAATKVQQQQQQSQSQAGSKERAGG